MNNYLKKYDVELTTVGPVFVGSGKEIGKKEYVFIGRDKVGIIDIQRFYTHMVKVHKEREFEDYMLKNNRDDLTQWLRNNHISIQDISSDVKYELYAGDAIVERGTKLQVMECVKNPYGEAYIPGSTLKGMLRTVLLGADMLQNHQTYQIHANQVLRSIGAEKQNRNTYLKRDICSIETTKFHTLSRKVDKRDDAVNDMMSGFIVSDSEPVKTENLVLCQKVDVHTDGREKRLNLLRECIKPEVKIRFTITVDSALNPITKETLFFAIKVFNQAYYDNFLSTFAGTDRIHDKTVYIGGGVGYVSKTITYPLLGKNQGIDSTVEIFENTKVPRNHKHDKDRVYGVSPHIVKCTNYVGERLQMGQCLMGIVD